MNISCNKKNLVVDTLYVKSNPVVGISGITSFSESLLGVTVTEFFVSKIFRYTKDGINYSDWEDLLLVNLTSLVFDSKDSVIFEVAYKKNTSLLSLDIVSIDFVTSTSSTNYNNTYFVSSIFSEFFTQDDLEVLNWYINVLQKVYKKGLLPNYLDQFDEETQSDEDFIDFWKAVTNFFSFFVIYGKQYGEFYQVDKLLREYLKGRNLKFSIHNSVTELQYLMKTYFHQILNRGTIHIIEDSSLSGGEVDGELLRMIHYLPTDEFLFNLHKNEHFGWNIGNSSPLWRGLYMNQNLYKSLESNEWVKVDSSISYGCKFGIQTDKEITITVESKDKDGNIVNLFSYKDGSISSTIIQDVILQRSDKVIFLHFFLYSHNKTPYINGTINLNQGNHLILNQLSSLIKINIEVDGNLQTLTQTSNQFCFYPLFTNYSHGIIQVPNWVSCWLKNSNKEFSDNEVKQFIRKYLIPYNSHLELFRVLEGGIEIVENEENSQLAWRGIDSICQFTEESIEVYYVGIDPYCEQDEEQQLPYWVEPLEW